MRSSPILHAITAALLLLVITLAIFIGNYLSQQDVIVSLVEAWGYPAVVVLGVISGLNAIIPIPAATLTPLFNAAGLVIPGIIASLVLGTMLADLIGFLFGKSTKQFVAERYPKLVSLLDKLVTDKRTWLIPFVIVYAAFVPLPNEVILIPLAFSGIRFSYLLIPLIIGNTLHQLVLVYGVIGILNLFS